MLFRSAGALQISTVTPTDHYRKCVLTRAIINVCKDRNSKYGEPEDNFKRIAALWNVYLEQTNITPDKVAMMLMLLKVARQMHNPRVDDNYDDIAGYAACAAEVSRSEKKRFDGFSSKTINTNAT